jgi:hypothetical protein
VTVLPAPGELSRMTARSARKRNRAKERGCPALGGARIGLSSPKRAELHSWLGRRVKIGEITSALTGDVSTFLGMKHRKAFHVNIECVTTRSRSWKGEPC